MSDETKHLPATVIGVVPRLQQAALAGDLEGMSDIIAWGYAGIAREYDPDPIFRPLNYVRKWSAEREWRRVIQATGQQLRATMTQKQVEAFQYELDRRIDERKWEDAERRRREAEDWNRQQRTTEYKDTHSFDTDEAIRLASALAEINGAAAAQPPPPDPWQEVQRIQAEISRIAKDPDMSNAEKHSQTIPLQTALARALDRAGGQT